jgi:hypothetical protein
MGAVVLVPGMHPHLQWNWVLLLAMSLKYLQPGVDCISFTNSPHTLLTQYCRYVLIFNPEAKKKNLACVSLTKEACKNYRCPEGNIEVFNAIQLSP